MGPFAPSLPVEYILSWGGDSLSFGLTQAYHGHAAPTGPVALLLPAQPNQGPGRVRERDKKKTAERERNSSCEPGDHTSVK